MFKGYANEADKPSRKDIGISLLWCGIYSTLSVTAYVWFAYGFDIFNILAIGNEVAFMDVKFASFVLAPIVEFFVFKFIFLNKVARKGVAFFGHLEHLFYTLLLVVALVVVLIAWNSSINLQIAIENNNHSYKLALEYLVVGLITLMALTKVAYAFPLRYELCQSRVR